MAQLHIGDNADFLFNGKDRLDSGLFLVKNSYTLSMKATALAVLLLPIALRRLLQVGQPFPQRIQSRLRPVSQVQLLQDVADVSAHRPLADDQRVGDLLVG